ncbi:hypothetical protein RIF29_20824 [Crotalaria pallida]|uniref:Uncharacterized protein n=1 Tax=Crotalaria pallida TaxID=3830 RepID=A0AAN9F257_CROPI
MRLMKVTEVNSEENLVQVEGVVVPTNIVVESGDVMIMEAGELKEAGGNQLQMVTTGSNSKDSMRSGGKATTENDQGGWVEEAGYWLSYGGNFKEFIFVKEGFSCP